MVTATECELYWRYPPNSFAYLCGTTIETSWICDDFLDSMLYHVSIIEFEFPDSGEICYPRASQGHYYDMPARYFFYEREADFDSAGAVLKRYTEQVISQYSGVGIHLIGWNNKDYMSWLFR